MEELTCIAQDAPRSEGSETDYEYVRAFISLLYRNYDWQFGAWAFLEGADKAGPRRAKDKIAREVPKLMKEYFIARRDETGLNAFLEKPANRRLDAAFLTMGEALLRARESFGRVVEVQFSLTDRFLYACWLLAGPKAATEVFAQILPHAFTFPKVDFETQYAACCKSAKKAHDAYERDPDNVASALESVYVHFAYVCDLIDLWRKALGDKGAKRAKRLEGLLYEWNVVHYIMPLHVAVHGFAEGDENFRATARALFDYSPDRSLTQTALRCLLDSARKLPELKSRKLFALHAKIEPTCERLLAELERAQRKLS